ncbi:MAG: metal ABC transporter permease, partial [Phycisphaeraceae bacterium]
MLSRHRLILMVSLLAMPLLCAAMAVASNGTNSPSAASTEHSVTFTDIFNTLTLQAPYNTRIVVLSVALLGIAAGVVGSFLLLRKRALMGDALSHATLPGVCLAFIIMSALGGDPKFLPGLLLGATITGLLGVAMVTAIHKYTRLKEDAALGIVLSVFFALGMALVKIVTDLPTGGSAGIRSFIYGRTATMGMTDLLLIGGAAAGVLAISFILFKEFSLLCFDSEYASSQGWPVSFLDGLMLVLVTIV